MAREVMITAWIRRRAFAAVLAMALMAALTALPEPANAGLSKAPVATAAGTPRVETPYRPGIVLVGLRAGVTPARQRALRRLVSGRWTRRLGSTGGLRAANRAPSSRIAGSLAIGVAPGGVPTAVQVLRRERRWIRYAEPDYLLHASGTATVPNDPSFPLEWGSQNTGQDVEGIAGASGDDDRAAQAWTANTGSRSIVIGEVDTGVDYQHPDLAANVWTNPGGVGGCPAGTHGYNVLTATCDPMDDDTAYGGHGTHVAGIMGAVGNNGVGVAGVNWSTTILPVKWLDSNASGDTGGLISALNWVVAAKQAGVNVHVVNDSATFVGTAYSQALSDEIDQLGANGILFVTAAGNTGEDDDDSRYVRYPCAYDRPTEICVTASDQNDKLPSWANYGPGTVDLAAPGEDIYSTLRGGSYGYISGGSMAAAQVSGAAALILSAQNMPPASLKADILDHVDPLSAMSGLVRTGGRLDVCAAIPGCGAAAASTFGYSTLGGSVDKFSPGRKRVNPYSLSGSGSVSKLSIYLSSAAGAGQSDIEGVLYADSGGSPGALLGTTGQVVFSGGGAAGWYDLKFPSALSLGAGRYWIGVITGGASGVAAFRYTSVSGARDYNSNAYSGGPSNPFGAVSSDNEKMSLYATYTPGPPPAVPVNTVTPAISGTAQTGGKLTARTGSWSGTPTAYAYSWSRCNPSGGACTSIPGASSSTYAIQAADLSSTLRVSVTASNASGSSAPATSAPTAVVKQGLLRLGYSTVGGSVDTFSPDRKRVNPYSLSGSGSVSKLSIYLSSAAGAGQSDIEGVLYADSGGSPGALLGTTGQVVFSGGGAAGWRDLKFPSALSLGAGRYWIGVITGGASGVAAFRYTSVSGARDYNSNAYSGGPSNPFGAVSSDNEKMSLYASYAPS